MPACAAIEACADDGWSEAALREELAQENARLFVAEAEGKVAGLAVFQLVCGEASLYAVSTAPAFRRQGVARLTVCGLSAPPAWLVKMKLEYPSMITSTGPASL